MLDQFFSITHCEAKCIYLVGGAVRDRMLGLKPHDEDYLVIGDFNAVKSRVKSIGTIVHEDPRYGLVRGKVQDTVHEFVMARRDGTYTDHRHCEQVVPGSILDDLSRRDFTVNAIALDVFDGTITDPFNGTGDIAQRTLRCVGKAQDRLSEDPLRIVRALRFMITHNLEPDTELDECLHSTLVNHLQYIPGDRVRQELNKCLHYDPESTLNHLTKYPVLMRAVLTKVNFKTVTK